MPWSGCLSTPCDSERQLRLVDVKTRKSRRVVRLPLVALRGLQRHRKRQADERERANGLWTETGLVFTSPTGAPLDPDVVTHAFQRTLRRHGLPHRRFHDLRHACASLLLAQGLDLKVIQEVLGHSTITITGDLYADVLMGLDATPLSASTRCSPRASSTRTGRNASAGSPENRAGRRSL